MRKKGYYFAFLSFAVFIVSILFLYPNQPASKVDDFAAKIFYILNKNDFRAEEIVVAEIDDKSLKKISEQWPFKRSVYARALDILRQEDAAVVAFDLAFVGDGASVEDDAEFSRALSSLPKKVVLAYFLDAQANPVYPKKEFRDNSLAGFINVAAGSDRVIRKARAYYQKDDFSDFSLPFKAVAAFYGKGITLEGSAVSLGRQRVFLDSQGMTNINYLISPDNSRKVSFVDLLEGKFPPRLFSGKIVLISPTLRIAHDIHATPLGYLPGAFIQANVMAGILKGKPLDDLPFSLSILILFLSLILVARICTRLSFLRGILISLGFLILLFWADIILKYFGWQFAFGRTAVSCLVFLVLIDLYLYLIFLANILKLKNQMITDPYSGLYNMRYLTERINFESASISLKTNYLILVKLGGFEAFSEGKDFDSLKDIWRGLASVFLGISRLWAKYDTETVIGRVSASGDAEKLKKILERYLFSHGLKVKIKIGIFKIKHGSDIRNLIMPFFEKVDAAANEIEHFQNKDFSLESNSADSNENLISALSLDAEDKNHQLLESIRRIKAQEGKTRKAYLDLVTSLVTALESKDPYTQGHTKRVCDYSLMLADKLGLGPQEREKIQRAALLHDLGKIGIPDAILHKKGKLTEEEFAVIKEHEVLSAQILEPIEEFKEIIPYVIHHHEAFDGSGYPHGLAGEFIPFGARLISVADIFDALTTGRDYKNAFSVKDSVEELKKIKGSKLDPAMVDKFIEALKESRLL